MATPQKWQCIPDNRDDDEYLPVTPDRQAWVKKSHSGVSCPQIKDVLGGSDQGWGVIKYDPIPLHPHHYLLIIQQKGLAWGSGWR